MENREYPISVTESGREKDEAIHPVEAEEIPPMAMGTQPNIPRISDLESRPNFPSSSPVDFKEMLSIADRISEKIARKLPDHISREDIIAAGRLGLTDAYAKYDSSQGPFLPYAETRIRGAVLDELRGGDILPRQMRNKIKKEKKAGLRDDNGPQPQGLDYAYKTMTNLAAENADRGLYEGLVSPATQEEEANRAEIGRIVRDAIAKLPEERDRQIYQMYYVDGLTVKEIGDRIGVTTSRVSQLLSRAERRVKEFLPEGLV
jgi:RNA polymerase sigma factor for flagellar operon FliA